MKRNSKSYRLQLIKETVERRERRMSSDPMVSYIEHLMSEQPDIDKDIAIKHRFAGYHFDENSGGWVADQWH